MEEYNVVNNATCGQLCISRGLDLCNAFKYTSEGECQMFNVIPDCFCPQRYYNMISVGHKTPIVCPMVQDTADDSIKFHECRDQEAATRVCSYQGKGIALPRSEEENIKLMEAVKNTDKPLLFTTSIIWLGVKKVNNFHLGGQHR